MSRNPDPAWLVLRAQAGDREAMERLLRHTQSLLHGYVRAVAGEPDMAADVVQDALLTVFRKLHALQEPRAYNAWARRIASRLLFAAMRRERAREAIHEEFDASIPAPDSAEQPALDAEMMQSVPELLASVSPASREVLVLHYLEELPIAEIASTLDLPIGTVKSRLAYGLRTLRQLVHDSTFPALGPHPGSGRNPQ